MPNIENLKKQAKQYLRWHRERYYPVAAQIRACASPKLHPRRKSRDSLPRQLEEKTWMGPPSAKTLSRGEHPRGDLYMLCKDGGTRAFSRRYSFRIRQPDRTGGAALRVAHEKECDLRLWCEFCRLAFPSRVRDACGPRGTSRQRNTHNIESREVRYAWHPWHARAVAVHGALTKNGRGVFRCGIDENPGVRLLEIPQWMFDSVACCHMRLATVPTVSCGALLDLKALLRCASFPDSDVVLQSQHRSLLSPGDADAKITKPTESRSIQTISSTPEAPVLAGAACRNQTENSKVAGATAARAHRKSPRLRQQKGGGR